MTDPRTRPDDAPMTDDRSDVDEIAALQGEAPFEDQDGALELDEIETERTPTQSELDSGAVTIPDREYARSGATALPDGAVESLDALELDALEADGLRDGETDDPLVAIEEGLTYVPPSDPPTARSDDPGGIDVARSIDDLEESDVNARVRAAIRGDAATSPFADRLEIAVLGSTAILRGTVDDLTDGDALVAVVETVEGIDEVRDETEVASLG